MGKLLSILFLLFLISCSDNDEFSRTTEENTYPVELATNNTFGIGDEIGVYPVYFIGGSEGVLGDIANKMNIRYRFDGAKWANNDDENYLLTDGSSLAIYAYYPYDPQMSAKEDKLNLQQYPFDVSGDQSVLAKDFLWAKSVLNDLPSGNRANFVFRHLLSKIVINISSGSTVIQDVSVHNTITSCTINMRNGDVTVSDKNDIIQAVPHDLPEEGYDVTFEAILIPQQLVSGTTVLLINTDAGYTFFNLPSDLNLLSGSIYTFNLTLVQNLNRVKVEKAVVLNSMFME